MKKFLYLFLVVINYLFHNPVGAENIELREKIEVLNENFVDSTNKISFEELLLNFQNKFVPSTVENSLMKDSSFAYWLRVKIEDSISAPSLYIRTVNAYKNLTIYVRINGTYKKIIPPQNLSDSRIYHIYRNMLIELPVPDQGQFVYFKFQKEHNGIIGLEVFTFYSFLYSVITDYSFASLFLGIILIISIYNLILFLILKEKVYLYYCLYVVSFGLFGLANFHLIIYLLPFLKPGLYLYTFPYSLMTIFLILYSISYFNVKTLFPEYYKILISVIFLRIIIFLIGAFTDNIFFYHAYVDVICLFPILLIAISGIKKEFAPSYYFIVAFGILYSGLIWHAIQPFVIFGQLSIFTIGVVEIILFSVALANRFKVLKNEKIHIQNQVIAQLKENELLKDKVNRELEEKVLERTEEIRIQKLEIERINALLKQDNSKLEKDVSEISKARVMQKVVTFEEFEKIYPTEDACYQFIYDIKWKNGYVCKKCQNTKSSKGPFPYSLKCTKCRYIETVTAHTIFNRLKFPIIKAMYILAVTKSRQKITIEELANRVNLRIATCFTFSKKVKEMMDANPPSKGKDDWSYLIIDSKAK